MDRNVIVKRIAEIERELCTLRESPKQKTVGDIPQHVSFRCDRRNFITHRPQLGWVKGPNPTFAVAGNLDSLLSQNHCSLGISTDHTIIVLPKGQVVDDE